MNSQLPVRPIDQYIARTLRRKRWVMVLRTLAAIVAALMLITALTVVLGQQFGYLDKIVHAARGFLLLVPIALIAIVLWLPSSSLRKDRGIRLLESRAPEFGGRIETYVEMRDGYSLRDSETGSLKARQAISRRQPRELSGEGKAVFSHDSFG